MEIELIMKAVVGLAVIGGVGVPGVFALSKAGWVHFGKNNTPNGQARIHEKVHEKIDLKHDKLDDTLKVLSDTQLIQVQIQKDYGKRLDKGENAFETIKEDITGIRISIAEIASK